MTILPALLGPRRAWPALLSILLLLSPTGLRAGALVPGGGDGPAEAPRAGSIVGTVTDAATNQPLSGVEVQIAALQLSSVTNPEGRFLMVNVPDGVHQISASRLGYGTETQEVTVRPGETATVDFRMSVAAIGLDELVVSAYAQSLRAVQTGATSEVGTRTIEKLPIQTAEQAIQGRVAGVVVNTVSGQPGAGMEVRVRGLGSIEAGNRPLYIVDGVQLSDRGLYDESTTQNTLSILAGLNPRDIASIEVLKDAAATSIYGAQAANGVVLITTRRGQEGATQWNFSSEMGLVKDPRVWDVLSGPEWVQLQMESYGNRYVDLGQTRAAGEQAAIAAFGDPSQVGSYDWQAAVRRNTGFLRSFNGSVSGGSDQTRFYFSGAYDSEEAQVVRTDFERATVRMNLEHQASNRLSLLTNIGLSKTTQNGQPGIVCANCPINWAAQIVPTRPPYNDDGSYNNSILPFPYSPVLQAHEEIQRSWNRQAIGNVTANYSISPHLNFRSLWALDYRVVRRESYRPPEMRFIGNVGSENSTAISTWNTNQVLNYVSTLGVTQKHNLSALAGVEYKEESFEAFGAGARGYPSGLFKMLSQASTPSTASGSTGGFKLASGFGRVEYDYANRYMLSASLRYDGSSRFGEDHRWGLFYSGSVGWNLKNESFLEGVDWLDRLTLRGSYGITGNADLSDYASLSLFGSATSYAGQPTLRPTQLGNNLLTWEQAKTIDFGLEWSAFSGRFHGSLDAVRTDNEDLLLDAYLPSTSGFSGVSRNTGSVRNKGIELELGGIPYRTTDFSWESSFTLAYYKNEITSLVSGLDHIGNNIRVGLPLRIHWGPRWAGVNPADGRPMWYDADGNITYQVTSDDYRYLGSPLPDVEGGWSNTFTYGPLTLSSFFQYSLGADVYMADAPALLNTGSGGNQAEEILALHWQQPGELASVPKAYTSSAQPGTSSFTSFSSRWIDDGSFIRLKTLRLDYDLPESLRPRLGGFQGTIYAAGYNLWLITEYSGIDPEIQAYGSGTWPPTRQFRFGIALRQ